MQRGVRGECGDLVGGSRGGHRVPAELIGGGFQGLKPVTAGLKSSPSSDFAKLLSHVRECSTVTVDLLSSWDTQLVSFKP